LNQKKTAILLFSFSEHEEKSRKSFLANTSLYQKLTQRVTRTILATGLDYFYFSNEEQIGDNFGTKFSDAIAKVYAKGYDNVITIGNDSPELRVDHILKAKDALENNHFVLGPSYDGGFYLMGLQKEHFEKTIFENFTWNTSKVASEIKDYINTSFGVQILALQYLRDIDRLSDLQCLLKTLSPVLNSIRNVIEQILQQAKKQHYPYVENISPNFLTYTIYNKGSPLLSL